MNKILKLLIDNVIPECDYRVEPIMKKENGSRNQNIMTNIKMEKTEMKYSTKLWKRIWNGILRHATTFEATDSEKDLKYVRGI